METSVKTVPFTHLHLHTPWSLLDGFCRIDELIELAKKFSGRRRTLDGAKKRGILGYRQQGRQWLGLVLAEVFLHTNLDLIESEMNSKKNLILSVLLILSNTFAKEKN